MARLCTSLGQWLARCRAAIKDVVDAAVYLLSTEAEKGPCIDDVDDWYKDEWD